MQNNPRTLLAWIAVIAAGLGCGWVLGMARPAQDSETSAVVPVLREPVRKALTAPLPPVPRLEEVLAAPASQRAGLIARYLRTADVAGMKTLLEQEWTREFTGLILLRWTALDPESAFGLGDGTLRYWCANDPDGAYKWALENSRGREQVEAACKFVADSDPDRVLRWLANDRAAPVRWRGSELIPLLEAVVAKQSGAEAAARFAMKHLTKPVDAFMDWAERDPEAAVRCVLTEVDPVLQFEVLEGLQGGLQKDGRIGRSLPPEMLRRAAALIPGSLKDKLVRRAESLEKESARQKQ